MDSALPKSQLKIAARDSSSISLRSAFAFLILGGGSMLLMAAFILLRQPQIVMQDQVRTLIQQGGAIALVSAVLFSYPHFVWSYRFAYQQGSAFVRKHSFSLLVFPSIMIVALVLCVIAWNQPVSTMPFLITVDNQLHTLGVDLQWSRYNGIGQLLLASLLIAQTIMAGHHYCMQAFGVALALGEDREYKLSPARKKILKLNLYALWAMNLFSGYTFFSILNNNNFVYLPPQFPAWLQLASTAVFCLSILLVFVGVVLPLRHELKKFPPFLGSVTILAIWVWLQPFCQPYGYQAWVVPLAHGAQYLWFACRAEGNTFAQQEQAQREFDVIRHLVVLTVVTTILGYVCLYYLPLLLANTDILKGVTTNFFLLALLFISMHHYIIDMVVWKPDSLARKSLRRPSA
jgi:hypothetical protein